MEDIRVRALGGIIRLVLARLDPEGWTREAEMFSHPGLDVRIFKIGYVDIFINASFR